MFLAFQLLSWKWGRGLVATEDGCCHPKEEGAAELAEERKKSKFLGLAGGRGGELLGLKLAYKLGPRAEPWVV